VQETHGTLFPTTGEGEEAGGQPGRKNRKKKVAVKREKRVKALTTDRRPIQLKARKKEENKHLGGKRIKQKGGKENEEHNVVLLSY